MSGQLSLSLFHSRLLGSQATAALHVMVCVVQP